MTQQKEKKVEEIRKEAEQARACPVQKALYYMEEFLSGPMCGRCFPCALGAYEARGRLQRLSRGQGGSEDVAVLGRISQQMLASSMCKKGKDSAAFLAEWLKTDVFEAHAQGRCPQRSCPALVSYRIVPELCIMCGDCQEVCKFNAILGEKALPYRSGYRPFEIRQLRCTSCGECVKVCPTNAIEVLDRAEAEKEKVQT